MIDCLPQGIKQHSFSLPLPLSLFSLAARESAPRWLRVSMISLSSLGIGRKGVSTIVLVKMKSHRNIERIEGQPVVSVGHAKRLFVVIRDDTCACSRGHRNSRLV